MKKIFTMFLILVHSISYTQTIATPDLDDEDMPNTPKSKPEIFTKGSMDISVNGQLNANARLVKLNLGEPNKFYVPTALFVGVTTRAIGNYQLNDELLQNFINPYAGLMSLCVDDERRFRKRPKAITGFSFVYQVGIKILNAYDTTARKFGVFHTQFVNMGIGFITQAWERDNNNVTKKGFFWVQAKVHLTKLPQQQVAKMVNKNYHEKLIAYSIIAGIDIDKSINFKFNFYKYLQNPITEKVQPMVQATVNYNFK
jgi:hypothetical protein